jgi:chromosome segregation ATPase
MKSPEHEAALKRIEHLESSLDMARQHLDRLQADLRKARAELDSARTVATKRTEDLTRAKAEIEEVRRLNDTARQVWRRDMRLLEGKIEEARREILARERRISELMSGRSGVVESVIAKARRVVG